jgi:hypothetical protein
MITSRRAFIELIRRQIYGGQPSDDSSITVGLVNRYLDLGIAAAAKANYKENIAIDGISYISNSFYTTFKGISISSDENFLWKIELPNIPLGIGAVDGISRVVIKDNATNQISYPIVLLSENQTSYQRGMRSIPNKLIGYPEGKYVFILSTILLNEYNAQVTMVSGGSSSDLSATITVPDDYMPTIIEYVKQQLMFERSVPSDQTNDGVDIIKTT